MSWGYSYNGAQTATSQANAHFSGSFGSQEYGRSYPEDPPEPNPEDLHADWSDAWAPGITSSALRSEIASNPRLAKRLARLKAANSGAASNPNAAQGGQFFAQSAREAHHQETQSGGEENFQSLSSAGASIAARNAPRNRAQSASPQLTAYESYIKSPSEMIRQAGLIWNAASFARIIDGAQLRALSQMVSASELESAFSYVHLSMPTIAIQSLQPERLMELLRACGERAAFAWACQLPEELRSRALTTLPRIASTTLPDQIYRESAIMQAALETRVIDRGEMH